MAVVATLPPDALARFIKLANMLSSSFPNERAVAIVKCNELLQQHRMTWEELLLAPQQIASPPAAMPRTWRNVAEEILAFHPDVLRQSRYDETQFVSDLLARGWPVLSCKQSKWLADIARRAGVPLWDGFIP
jgi:hypothetical protein